MVQSSPIPTLDTIHLKSRSSADGALCAAGLCVQHECGRLVRTVLPVCLVTSCARQQLLVSSVLGHDMPLRIGTLISRRAVMLMENGTKALFNDFVFENNVGGCL